MGGGGTVHKEKFFLVDKEISGCSECDQVHRNLRFADKSKSKVIVLGPLSKSVFSGFEAGKTYWIEIKEV